MEGVRTPEIPPGSVHREYMNGGILAVIYCEIRELGDYTAQRP